MNELLSPKQVAQAIGVSESSLKRWCDQGLIPTVRTAGGHRRLTLGDVLRFVRDGQHGVVTPEALGLPAVSEQSERSLERGRELLVQSLLKGDEAVCRRLVFDLYLAKHPICTLCDDLIAAAFRDIGEKWSCQKAHVYQERRACEIMLRILHYLRDTQNGMDGSLLAVGATPAADQYTLPSAMVELVLREAGWNACSLGCSIPLASLTTALIEHKPRLFWLSVSYVEDAEQFVSEFNELYRVATSQGTAVVVGGFALSESIRPRLNYSAFCDTMRHLDGFAQTLRRTSSTPRP